MRNESMPKTVRLTQNEQEKIRKKNIEINKLLVAKDKAPMQESELVHFILEKTISYVKVDKDGEVFLDL